MQLLLCIICVFCCTFIEANTNIMQGVQTKEELSNTIATASLIRHPEYPIASYSENSICVTYISEKYSTNYTIQDPIVILCGDKSIFLNEEINETQQINSRSISLRNPQCNITSALPIEIIDMNLICDTGLTLSSLGDITITNSTIIDSLLTSTSDINGFNLNVYDSAIELFNVNITLLNDFISVKSNFSANILGINSLNNILIDEHTWITDTIEIIGGSIIIQNMTSFTGNEMSITSNIDKVIFYSNELIEFGENITIIAQTDIIIDRTTSRFRAINSLHFLSMRGFSYFIDGVFYANYILITCDEFNPSHEIEFNSTQMFALQIKLQNLNNLGDQSGIRLYDSSFNSLNSIEIITDCSNSPIYANANTFFNSDRIFQTKQQNSPITIERVFTSGDIFSVLTENSNSPIFVGSDTRLCLAMNQYSIQTLGFNSDIIVSNVTFRILDDLLDFQIIAFLSNVNITTSVFSLTSRNVTIRAELDLFIQDSSFSYIGSGLLTDICQFSANLIFLIRSVVILFVNLYISAENDIHYCSTIQVRNIITPIDIDILLDCDNPLLALVGTGNVTVGGILGSNNIYLVGYELFEAYGALELYNSSVIIVSTNFIAHNTNIIHANEIQIAGLPNLSNNFTFNSDFILNSSSVTFLSNDPYEIVFNQNGTILGNLTIESMATITGLGTIEVKNSYNNITNGYINNIKISDYSETTNIYSFCYFNPCIGNFTNIENEDFIFSTVLFKDFFGFDYDDYSDFFNYDVGFYIDNVEFYNSNITLHIEIENSDCSRFIINNTTSSFAPSYVSLDFINVLNPMVGFDYHIFVSKTYSSSFFSDFYFVNQNGDILEDGFTISSPSNDHFIVKKDLLESTNNFNSFSLQYILTPSTSQTSSSTNTPTPTLTPTSSISQTNTITPTKTPTHTPTTTISPSSSITPSSLSSSTFTSSLSACVTPTPTSISNSKTISNSQSKIFDFNNMQPPVDESHSPTPLSLVPQELNDIIPSDSEFSICIDCDVKFYEIIIYPIFATQTDLLLTDNNGELFSFISIPHSNFEDSRQHTVQINLISGLPTQLVQGENGDTVQLGNVIVDIVIFDALGNEVTKFSDPLTICFKSDDTSNYEVCFFF